MERSTQYLRLIIKKGSWFPLHPFYHLHRLSVHVYYIVVMHKIQTDDNKKI
jgi:hypothetical protein